VPTRGVVINSANESTHAKKKPRPLVFVLDISRVECFVVDMYCDIRAIQALLVELYLLQETEFIRFFMRPRQHSERTESE
jgi:hypothetical protein